MAKLVMIGQEHRQFIGQLERQFTSLRAARRAKPEPKLGQWQVQIEAKASEMDRIKPLLTEGAWGSWSDQGKGTVTLRGWHQDVTVLARVAGSIL